MKELLGNTYNIALLEDDSHGKLVASIEIVALVSEPTYEAGPTGYIKKHSVETVRYAVHPAGLRKLAKEMIEIANEADALLARVTLAPPTKQDKETT